VLVEVRCQGLSLCRSFCNGEFSLFSIVFPNFVTYSGLEDSSRVSREDIDKKDLDKRVRALSTLTKDHEIHALTADFFDFEHPLPAVCAFSFTTLSFIFLLVFFRCFAYSFSTYSSAGSPVLGFSPSSSRRRTYPG
jgi:hypothetical protein